MRVRPLFASAALASACSPQEPTGPAVPDIPPFAVQQQDVDMPAVGAPVARTTGPNGAWWGMEGWSSAAEPTVMAWSKPVVSIHPTPTTDRAAIVWQDGTLSVGAHPHELSTWNSSDLSVKRAYWVQLDDDEASELVVAHQASDVVRAFEDDGTLMWEQRWGADVEHVLHVQGHALRIAHTDGIGLVVRTPSGDVVSRNRPNDSGRIRQLRVVHDVGTFDGPSIALVHQKPGSAAKADLFSPDGAAGRGTVRPTDLVGGAGTLALPSGYTVTADQDPEGAVTVRVAQEQQQLFSQILPHPSPTVQLLMVDGTPIVVTQDGARRFVISPGPAATAE